ncbi:MAG: rhomboid family intramembrane serine protease [Candidatus Nanohaloarchaea archaeon]
MAECSKCGKDSMSFTCRYCGKKFCSEHRLPENHDCEKLEEEVEKKREENQSWFEEKDTRGRVTPSEPPKPSLAKDILDSFRNSATLSIITVTVLAFLLQMAVPGFTGAMMLEPELGAIASSPWTLLTVMLVHGGLFHIFANMVTFYFFGTPLERITGSRDLVKFYLGSGVVASIGYVAFRNLLYMLHGASMGGLPTLGPAVGASGAVVAVFAAVAMLHPEAEVLLYFFIPMKIRTALYMFAGIEGVNLLAKTAGITLPVIGNFASSAHLAGLVIGVWYGRKMREKHARSAGVLDLLGY